MFPGDPERAELPFRMKEVDIPWLGNLTTLVLFEHPDLTFNDLTREAARMDAGNKYAAWNDVRLIRSPQEILPAGCYHAGLEGYPVGIWPAPEIYEQKIGFGRQFLDGIVRDHRYDNTMRSQVSKLMDSRHPQWGLKILQESDAFVGATLARLRVLALNSRDPKIIAKNGAFRSETYQRTRFLPPTKFVYDPESHMVRMSYAVRNTAVGDGIKPPMSRDEESLLALSRACAVVNPLVRTLLHYVPDRPFSRF